MRIATIILLASAVAAAQGRQPADSVSGLLVGQVVDAGSGRPVAGALVALGGPPGPRAPRPPVLTGNDGRFVFRDLRRGTYSILVQKPGFVEGGHGRRRPGGPTVPLEMADGERRGDITVLVWRHAAISGTIVDESGERQIGVQVRAFRRTTIGGKRRFVPSGSAMTDDRGEYRIGALLPGDYIVGTSARQTSMPLSMTQQTQPWTTGALPVTGELGPALISGSAGYVLARGMPTPPPATDGRLHIYPATFHPAAPAGSAATVITVRSGEEHAGADLQLTPVSTVRVSGIVAGPEGPVTATAIRLVPSNTIELPLDTEGLVTTTDRSGAFVFAAVPSGLYSLRLTRGQAPGVRPITERTGPPVVWADLPLNVGIEDIVDLGVEARTGVRVSGRFEFDGDASKPRGNLANVQVSIEPVEMPSRAPMPYIVRPDRFGEFTSRGIPGGQYYIRVPDSPPGWMLKSVTVEGRDVADAPMNLSSDVPNVVVTFTDKWSGVHGTVTPSQQESAVVVFPVDADAWGSSGLNPRRMRSLRTSASGEYSANLPPGDYYLVALREEDAADWQDPDFLASASRAAARVRIGEGERRLQDLRIREVR